MTTFSLEVVNDIDGVFHTEMMKIIQKEKEIII